jgi:hypothetical protein
MKIRERAQHCHAVSCISEKNDTFFSTPNNGQNVRFQVSIAVNMNSTIFWDVTPCHLEEAHVSEEHTASIFTLKNKPRKQTRHHIPEESTFQWTESFQITMCCSQVVILK